MVEPKYLKEIYRAYEKGIPNVGPTYMGKTIGVNKATAYQALQKLASTGYGMYLKNKGFVLNENGKKYAKILMRKHRLLECLIVETFGLSPCEACREASNIDALLGEKISKALEEKYNHRRVCPCGNEIPEVKI
ncbi:MAG: metal-dependent transcriptional regulator [Thermoplasmata archaeon]|nr:MAG: metal-dependent transcriptional regulator [Thermoplasmata archaeon]